MNRLDYEFMERINAKTDPERALQQRALKEQEAFDDKYRWVYGILLVITFLVVFCLDTPH